MAVTSEVETVEEVVVAASVVELSSVGASRDVVDLRALASADASVVEVVLKMMKAADEEMADSAAGADAVALSEEGVVLAVVVVAAIVVAEAAAAIMKILMRTCCSTGTRLVSRTSVRFLCLKSNR